MKKEEFTIEYQWKQYLQMGGMVEEQLPEVQRKELKKAFFAGISQLLNILKEATEEIGPDEGVEILDAISDEAQRFWLDQIISHNEYSERILKEREIIKKN